MRRLTRFAILSLGMVVGVLTLGSAAHEGGRHDLGHKLMCICGCSQILIECNHVGCPDSDRMLGELRAAIDQGGTNNAVLVAFQDKYGPTVLAASLLPR